jgi:hypothetical protein
MSKRYPNAKPSSVTSRSNAATSLAARPVGNGFQDGIVLLERVAGKVHLRYEPGGERRPREKSECAPDARSWVVLPRIGAGLDRHETVAPLLVREAASAVVNLGLVARRAGLPRARSGRPHSPARPRPACAAGTPS